MTSYFSVKLDRPVLAKSVRVEKIGNNNCWDDCDYIFLQINEVETYERHAPVFSAIEPGQAVVGQPFDLLAGVSARDADGVRVANITYTVKKPDNTAAANLDTTDPSTETGNWTVTYFATDQYNLRSEGVTRQISVTRSAAGAQTPPTWNAFPAPWNGLTISLASLASAGTTLYNVLISGVSAISSDGSIIDRYSTPAISYTGVMQGDLSRTINTLSTSADQGTYNITYRATDRFGATVTTIRSVTINP
jgi:hypothetical protein